MLVINPEECIDCGVCEPECPASAIKSDKEEGMDKWVKFNVKYVEQWPLILNTTDPLNEAKELDGVKDKLTSHFIDKPSGRVA